MHEDCYADLFKVEHFRERDDLGDIYLVWFFAQHLATITARDAVTDTYADYDDVRVWVMNAVRDIVLDPECRHDVALPPSTEGRQVQVIPSADPHLTQLSDALIRSDTYDEFVAEKVSPEPKKR